MAGLKIGKQSQALVTRPDSGNAVASKRNRYVLAGATVFCALSIGFVMQNGTSGPKHASGVAVEDIVMASSGSIAPLSPPQIDAPGTETKVAAPQTPDPDPDTLPASPIESISDACAITMDAEVAAGALVDLALNAPCNAGERFTLHHSGMMFTGLTGADGTLSMTVPALNENAVFIAAFAAGDGAVANTTVTSLPFYDRVVVQWRGDAGLQLHAREFSSDYFSDGHVWAASAGALGKAANGEGGFLVRLGDDTSPEALRAEVYSFPTGTARKSGQIALTVEAEVTSSNCDRQVEAQTLELRNTESLRTRDVLLEIPACNAVGDFLVLKNLFEDLTIAAR